MTADVRALCEEGARLARERDAARSQNAYREAAGAFEEFASAHLATLCAALTALDAECERLRGELEAEHRGRQIADVACHTAERVAREADVARAVLVRDLAEARAKLERPKVDASEAPEPAVARRLAEEAVQRHDLYLSLQRKSDSTIWKNNPEGDAALQSLADHGDDYYPAVARAYLVAGDALSAALARAAQAEAERDARVTLDEVTQVAEHVVRDLRFDYASMPSEIVRRLRAQKEPPDGR